MFPSFAFVGKIFNKIFNTPITRTTTSLPIYIDLFEFCYASVLSIFISFCKLLIFPTLHRHQHPPHTRIPMQYFCILQKPIHRNLIQIDIKSRTTKATRPDDSCNIKASRLPPLFSPTRRIIRYGIRHLEEDCSRPFFCTNRKSEIRISKTNPILTYRRSRLLHVHTLRERYTRHKVIEN